MEFFHLHVGLSKIYSDGKNSSAQTLGWDAQWSVNMHAFQKHLLFYKRVLVHTKKQSTSL